MGSKDNESLIKIHKRRLSILKDQHATLGTHAPPHILMEIRDIEKKITHLGATITPYKPEKVVRKPERVTTCPQCKAPIKLPPRSQDDKSPFIVYSVRVDTSIECGHCGTIIPNQFAEGEQVETTKQGMVEVSKEVATTPIKKRFSWFLNIFGSRD